MNERAVVCALVVDPAQRVLLVKNPKWGDQFALPSKQVEVGAGRMSAAALAAVREDLGLPLPNASVAPLGYLGTAGLSGRTGEPTLYQYWAFRVEAGEPITLPAGRAEFRSHAAIAASTDVTWSAQHVVEAIFQNQEVAVAVLTRPGRTQTEYLTLWNDNYAGYFFPAARVTADHPPESVARALVRAELGYTGPVTVAEKAEVPEFQFSARWGHARAYRFHVVAVQLPPWHDEVMDLHRPLGPMEKLLAAAEDFREPPAAGVAPGWSWRWLTADEFRTPPPGVTLTPTMAALVPSVLAAIPPVVSPLRKSFGGVAFIPGGDRYGRPGWLAQWNEGWGAFFLIGGQREAGESFAECVAREVGEELEIAAGEAPGFTVVKELANLNYIAWSRRAEQYTEYEMHAFEVTLSPERRAAVLAAESELRLRWLSPAEIRAKETTDGRRVSETAEVMLTLAGQL